MDKSITAEEELSELKADVEVLRLNLQLARDRVRGNTDKIAELEGMLGRAPPVPASVSGGDIDINALGQIFAS